MPQNEEEADCQKIQRHGYEKKTAKRIILHEEYKVVHILNPYELNWVILPKQCIRPKAKLQNNSPIKLEQFSQVTRGTK